MSLIKTNIPLVNIMASYLILSFRTNVCMCGLRVQQESWEAYTHTLHESQLTWKDSAATANACKQLKDWQFVWLPVSHILVSVIQTIRHRGHGLATPTWLDWIMHLEALAQLSCVVAARGPGSFKVSHSIKDVVVMSAWIYALIIKISMTLAVYKHLRSKHQLFPLT